MIDRVRISALSEPMRLVSTDVLSGDLTQPGPAKEIAQRSSQVGLVIRAKDFDLAFGQKAVDGLVKR